MTTGRKAGWESIFSDLVEYLSRLAIRASAIFESLEGELMDKVGVVYLDRWNNPPEFPRAFLDSLARNPTTAKYDLIWQFKGYPDELENPVLSEFSGAFDGALHVCRYPDDLFQFSLSFDAARRFEYTYLIFFISWSRILAPCWLDYYLDTFDRYPNCGVVGATGSYEKLFYYQAFPNPHIRTNAFMMRRDVFLSLDAGELKSIFDGNLLEAGPNSLTRQLESRGLQTLVIDRFGKAFKPPDWPRSRTFRRGAQGGLLVADNRTDEYGKAAEKIRRKLEKQAWGHPVKGLATRLRFSTSWRLQQLARHLAPTPPDP